MISQFAEKGFMEAFPYSQACLDCQIIRKGKNLLFHLLYRLSKANPILLPSKKLHYVQKLPISKFELFEISCFFNDCLFNFCIAYKVWNQKDLIMFRMYLPLLKPNTGMVLTWCLNAVSSRSADFFEFLRNVSTCYLRRHPQHILVKVLALSL